MEATGVFNSWVTALIKASCCSLRRISRTRKVVLRTTPTMITRASSEPRNSRMPVCQRSSTQPMYNRTITEISPAPSAIKNATDLRRPATTIVPGYLKRTQESEFRSRNSDGTLRRYKVLGSREREQRADVVTVGVLQRRDIALPQGAGISQTLPPPRKFFSVAPHHQEICHEPGMSAVAIWEWMDLNQPVMEAYGDLIG